MKSITVTLSEAEAKSLAEFKKSWSYTSDEAALRGALELASKQTTGLGRKKIDVNAYIVSKLVEAKDVEGVDWLNFPKQKPGKGTLAIFDHGFPNGYSFKSCYLDATAFGKMFK